MYKYYLNNVQKHTKINKKCNGAEPNDDLSMMCIRIKH
jgi:hypothetical protein